MKEINVTPTEDGLEAQFSTALTTVNGDLRPKLSTAFAAFASQADRWMKDAAAIVVRDETDEKAMEQARIFRLKIRGVRIDAGKAHEVLKKEILPYSKALDSCERLIRTSCEAVEATLLEKEEFAERKAERERQERAEQRRRELTNIQVDPVLYATQCLEFTAEQWPDFVQGLMDAVAAKKQREQELETKRLADLAEANRLRLENAKLAEESRKAAAELAKANKMIARVEAANVVITRQLQPVAEAPKGLTTAEKITLYAARVRAVEKPEGLPLAAREIVKKFETEVQAAVNRMLADTEHAYPSPVPVSEREKAVEAMAP